MPRDFASTSADEADEVDRSEEPGPLMALSWFAGVRSIRSLCNASADEADQADRSEELRPLMALS
jgi:hypothetical protein